MSDYQLVGIVGALVVVDVIIFTVRECLDPQMINITTTDVKVPV